MCVGAAPLKTLQSACADVVEEARLRRTDEGGAGGHSQAPLGTPSRPLGSRANVAMGWKGRPLRRATAADAKQRRAARSSPAQRCLWLSHPALALSSHEKWHVGQFRRTSAAVAVAVAMLWRGLCRGFGLGLLATNDGACARSGPGVSSGQSAGHMPAAGPSRAGPALGIGCEPPRAQASRSQACGAVVVATVAGAGWGTKWRRGLPCRATRGSAWWIEECRGEGGGGLGMEWPAGGLTLQTCRC